MHSKGDLHFWLDNVFISGLDSEIAAVEMTDAGKIIVRDKNINLVFEILRNPLAISARQFSELMAADDSSSYYAAKGRYYYHIGPNGETMRTLKISPSICFISIIYYLSLNTSLRNTTIKRMYTSLEEKLMRNFS